MRWCEYPSEWKEVLQLSLKDDLTADDKKRLKELRAIFGESKEIRVPKIATVYDAIYAGEVVITATADIVANFIGMSNEKFHSAARRHLDRKGAFDGFTVRYSDLDMEEYIEQASDSVSEIILAFDMSATRFSDLLGMAQSAVNNWARGEKKPSAAGLEKMSRLTGLTVPEILDGTGKIDPKRIEEVKNPKNLYDIIDYDGNIVLQAPLNITARALGVNKKTLRSNFKRAQRLNLQVNGYMLELSELTDEEYFDRIDSVVEEYIENNDMTLNELLKEAGIQYCTYRHWKNYEAKPALYSLLKLSEVMDMSVFDLVRGSKWDKEV